MILTLLKEKIFRSQLKNYTKQDVYNYLEENSLSLSENSVDEIAYRYAYEGDYDCNLSYWTNIGILVNEYIEKEYITRITDNLKEQFIKKGWSTDTSFSLLTLEEAVEKGYNFAIDGIKKGQRYFKMDITGNIYKENGKIAFFNV